MPAVSRRHLVRVALFAALAAGLLAASADAAPRPIYLALGDSVTFGYEEPGVVPSPRYGDATSFVAYPELVGAALGLKVVNAACPGETSASLIDPSAPSLGCENAYRRASPLHVRYRGGQLSFAVRYLRHHHRAVRVVSLMIGANDLFRCQATTADGCSAELPRTLRRVGRDVRRIVAALRDQGHYRGRLAIVGYYALDYASAVQRRIVARLNATVRGAARPFGIVVANGFGRLSAAARHSAGNSCDAGLLTQLGRPGKCGIHPSYAGQALLALAVADALAR
jgi:lysophospholipase L1-like esterase